MQIANARYKKFLLYAPLARQYTEDDFFHVACSRIGAGSEAVSATSEPRYEHLLFAGNGMSALACVEALLRTGRPFDITIIGDEPHGNYDRALLASVLAGERDIESITLNDIEWYQENGIRTRLGIRVEEINRPHRGVRTSDGDWINYDKLILATGARPPVPDMDLFEETRVFVFSTFDDARRLAEAARPDVRTLVIGGSLATEVACALRKLGCDAVAATENSAVHELADAHTVVIATDPQPNVTLAKAAGLRVNRGIVVNDCMATSDPHIFAVGACAECIAPLAEQAELLASAVSRIAAPPARREDDHSRSQPA